MIAARSIPQYAAALGKLVESGAIEVASPIPTRIFNGIPYRVNAEVFDVTDGFTMLTDAEFDVLIRNNPRRGRESSLLLYLYIKSFYHKKGASGRPAGFCKSRKIISRDLLISVRTVGTVIQQLVDDKLLFRHRVGSYMLPGSDKEIRTNVPNIYIPNLGQSSEEIEKTVQSTIDLMKEKYGVDEFLPFLENGKEN